MNLEKLVAGHAYWSDKKRELKQKGSEELSMCKGLSKSPSLNGMIVGDVCISSVFREFKEGGEEGYYSSITFDEVWAEMDAGGEICEHCKTVMSLKADRVKASRHLGAIRAAMTRVGRKIEYRGEL